MSTERYPHLDRTVAEIADADNATRIAYIGSDRFIAHEQAVSILEDFESLFAAEDAIRPQGRLLIGKSLMGKTTLLTEFWRRHPPDDNPDGEAAHVPVVVIQYPETAKEGIYPEILARLNVRLPSNAKERDLRRAAVEMLRKVGCRVLIIDEMHNLLEGSSLAQRKGLNSIKYMMNELGRPVIAAGTDEVFNAVRTDLQIKSRLRPRAISRFQDDAAFQCLLACFELVLPLRQASNLADVTLSQSIHELTLGVVGNVADLLNRAAIEAIRSGAEKIDKKILEKCIREFPGEDEIKMALR